MRTERTTRRGLRLRAVCLAIWVAPALGCRGESEPMRPPGTELARASLASALDAWKAGRPAGGKLLGSNPGIGVVDTLQAERPLIDFEILGSLFALPEARPFAVRLTLDSPRQVLSTRYVVLGRDPIWVFRQEDYELILHWEHKMTPEKAEDAAPGPRVPPETRRGPDR